jgi:hypothetical protein
VGARSPEPLDDWFAALERRHLTELSFAEVRRGLVALSSDYVERRSRLATGGALAGRGKRAAFALFYGPLHFAVTRHAVRSLEAAAGIDEIWDLGCGSGAAGAGWATVSGGRPALRGFDLHPWAVEETAWTWRWFGLPGRVARARLERTRLGGRGTGLLVAYTANELEATARDALAARLLAAHERGARVLVVEPVARRIAPWWDSWAARFEEAGGRADVWRFEAALPERWRLLDRAAGLDHRELVARTLLLR